MDRLAANLLTLARLDAGSFHLESEAVDLSAVAASAVRRLAPLARDKGLAVSEDYAAEAVVLGDREALEQAALILVENAIKYTDRDGHVTVRTATRDGHSELIVEDTGVGIPPEALPHLGQRFYRVDQARSRDAGGAGLGLAIAFGIASAHGGSISIRSTPGHGMTAALTVRGLATT